MDLQAKIRTIPTEPGVYLYKNAEGEVIYVGKAKNLRSRVASYFHEGRWEDAKTGTLVREAVDVDYIVVANNKEALALENNLIKQRKPRFNILLRDDKTYPYVKLTLGERWPRVYVTRRLRKDGSAYYGPYFPANLAYRIVDLIHRNFLIPSCKVDLTRFHPRPCLQYYIKRCLGPCVQELTTPEAYQEAVRDVKLFLEGRPTDLERSLHARMEHAAAEQEYERAARYRDLISTVEQLQERQRMAAAEGDDADVFGYHFENGMLAVNLFHMRGGKMVDRREFFWEELPEFARCRSISDDVRRPPSAVRTIKAPRIWTTAWKRWRREQPSFARHRGSRAAVSTRAISSRRVFFGAAQAALHRPAVVPRNLYVPVDFEDREALEDCSRSKRGQRACDTSAYSGPAARREALADRPGRQQREAVLRPALPRVEAERTEDTGSVAGRAQPAGAAEADRVLRHLAHTGRRDGGVHGGVGRRQDEEIGLPQVHHPHGGRQGRFRIDAGSGDAPLQASAG